MTSARNTALVRYIHRLAGGSQALRAIFRLANAPAASIPLLRDDPGRVSKAGKRTARLDFTKLDDESLRRYRALSVLEYAGTPEAAQVLQTLAAGPADDWLTSESRASLARLVQLAKK